MASNGSCIRCAALEAENRQLKEQLERAKKLIEKMKRILKWVIGQLRGVLAFVCHVRRRADKVLKKKSGISPRRWGWAKGAKWVATEVMMLVGGIIAKLEAFMMILDDV